jgi:hypothetical protein
VIAMPTSVAHAAFAILPLALALAYALAGG